MDCDEHGSTVMHTALSQLLCQLSEPTLCLSNTLHLYERWVLPLFSIIHCATKCKASSTSPQG